MLFNLELLDLSVGLFYSLGKNIHTQVLSTGGNFSWVEYIPSSVIPRGVVRYCKRIYVPILVSMWWLAIGHAYITRGSKDFGKDNFHDRVKVNITQRIDYVPTTIPTQIYSHHSG